MTTSHRRTQPRPSLPGLRSARLARGLSQLALGLEAEVHPTTIHALENGLNRARRGTVAKLAAALRVDPAELFGLDLGRRTAS